MNSNYAAYRATLADSHAVLVERSFCRGSPWFDRWRMESLITLCGCQLAQLAVSLLSVASALLFCRENSVEADSDDKPTTTPLRVNEVRL
jgi:hypothetical protein